MNNHSGISFHLLLVIGSTLLLFGFLTPIAAQQFSYKLYTVDDGLPTNAIYGGLQDSRGYIWFYTEKGISRFDGYTFKNFTVKDGLPTNDIFMLTEDAQGRLWVHSFGRRLVRIEGDSIYTIAEDQEQKFHIFAIFEDGQRVWFKNNNRKLLIAENGAGFDTVSYPLHRNVNQQRVSSKGVYPFKWNTFLRLDSQSGRCQLITSEGVALVEEFQMQGMDTALATKLITKLHNSFSTFSDGLFIQPFSDSILYHLDLKQRRVTEFNLITIFGEKPDLIRYYQQDGQLQVQSNLGTFILNEDLQVVDVFKAKLPESIRLDRIFKDREGNYWVSSKQKGVFFLTAEERNAAVIVNPSRAEDNAITCLTGDANGSIYAGTRRGTVYRLSPENLLEPLLFAPPSRYNDAVEVKAMAFDDADGLWLSRQSIGLERYDLNTGKIEHFSKQTGKAFIDFQGYEKQFIQDSEKDVLSLYVKGLAWNTAQGQLAIARAKYPFIYSPYTAGAPTINLMSSQRTHTVAFDQQGRVWMGQYDGLAVFDRGNFRRFDDDPQLDKVNIWDVATDKKGTIWAGTDGFGLFAFDGRKAIPIQGTQHDIIQDVFVSPEGQIWIATNQGVKGITAAPILEDSRVVRVLTTNSGLPTNEADAVYVDEKNVYVGTNEGLTAIGRALPFQDSTAPLLIMNEIRINGVSVPIKQSYTLSYSQNEIEFQFTGLSYKSFGNITYAYQLENADKAVQKVHSRQVRYSGLSPETYTFQITAIDIKGVNSLPMNPIVFTILPPWWQSRLAMVGWAVLIAGLIWSIYRWRVNTIRRKADEKTAINKRFAELELQALQAQMNPHFVFNSLGAIQYFIQNNDKKQADLYLSKFAFLMRLFLESSKNKYISLGEELRLIRLYVELEQLRFKGKFDFELHVPETVNPHTTLLPTMLLQPFIENAINHGLFHKDGKGLLKLSIGPMINGQLKFVIEDDGIGRDQAMKIRRQSDKNYQSRASQITSERLQTLQEVEAYHIGLNIEDLFDETGVACGTRVTLEIPEIE